MEVPREELSAYEEGNSSEDPRGFEDVRRRKPKNNDSFEEIFAVEETKGKWVRSEAEADSCAADNVLPSKMFPDFPTVETAASKAGKSYSAANGMSIANEGDKVIEFMTNAGTKRRMKFQVA